MVTLGIPYPSLFDIEIKEKKNYNSYLKDIYPNGNNLSGNDWYENQAFRALNQALGRCIRSLDDWGGIFLVDARFTDADKRTFLPSWIKRFSNGNWQNYTLMMENFKKWVEMNQANKRD